MNQRVWFKMKCYSFILTLTFVYSIPKSKVKSPLPELNTTSTTRAGRDGSFCCWCRFTFSSIKIEEGCPTYGLRARIWLARHFHLTCKAYEAYWISCQTDWRFPAKTQSSENPLTWRCWVIHFKLITQVLLLSTKWNSQFNTSLHLTKNALMLCYL